MLRRRHKKSRKGCLECKRRHIKCDETRPRCINCSTAQRECPYPVTGDGAENAPAEVPASPGISPTGSGSVSGLGPGPISSEDIEILPEVPPFPTAEYESPKVDMVHMELLNHFLTDGAMVYPLAVARARSIVMEQALRESYLMHQILAISARHLSIIRPHNETFYHTQAMQLQTHALSLFNSIDISYFEASVDNRVPGFIFSAVLGFHGLCDMLSHRNEDFPSVLARFVGYLHLHRGVYHIMEGHWEEIQETDLKPIFDEGMFWFQMVGKGHECDDIRERIELAGLETDELEATCKAIDLLQCVFDGQPDPVSVIHVLISWGAMVPKPFINMVETGRPEAMAVLAYYFLALHRLRHVWMIGDAGQFLLRVVVDYLNPEWSAWVEKPYRLLMDYLEGDALESQHQLSNEPGYSPGLTMARDFTILRPTAADAARIAEIHLAAMDSNPLLHVQFPTPESLEALRAFLATYTASQLDNPVSGVLVARDPETGGVASFAKWDSPSHPENVKLESGDLQYSEGCSREFLDGYVALAEEAKARSFGDKACYRLSFVCTDPANQGQGAGRLLTRRVLEMAAADGLPVYLESTEVAVPMYEKFGFKAIDAFEMEIPTRSGSTALSEIYREVCMLWHPTKAASSQADGMDVCHGTIF
ncbi:hypothetical protein B0H67DRAFT_495469 [Lasiosphaeris hirsuta]|uniref:Zn(2)-C6 fungal-type domain-containing protein n=1 Tax=Lasiosphaeris hirsuta TaxID=260670 RepID=A0AA40A2S9_9PEZI|nr:hypothetical protein B0H67DRAFT_495469 [Lasiosphaeris hirsuta]